jgi:hypothetical protein
MTTKAFVTALRGPEDTPDNISPLSWLKTAIITLQDNPPCGSICPSSSACAC